MLKSKYHFIATKQIIDPGVEIDCTNVETVFDNLYSKPPSNGSQFSIPVIFSVEHVFYYGQFVYTENEWHTIPGGEKSHVILDKKVCLWFYPPDQSELFEKWNIEIKRASVIDDNSRMQSISQRSY